MGSYEILTPANVSGVAGMQPLASFTALPIGVYILNGSTFINNAYNSNLQFGLNGTTQNGDLQNLLAVSSSVAGIVRLTALWVQTSAVNVFFSGTGSNNFQFISFSYLRIA